MTARDIAAKMKNMTIRTEQRDKAEKMLADLHIPVGSTDYPQVAPSQSKNNIVIRTNFFEIEMKKKIKVYQYRIDGALEFENFAGENERFGQFLFTRVSQADVLNIRHSDTARRALMLSCMANPGLMPRIERLYYDGANMLFSLDPIGNEPEVRVHTQNQMVPTVDQRAVAIRIRLTRTENQITLGQLEREQRPRFECNEDLRPLLQFIEIATSEHAIQQDQHVMFRGGVAMIRDPLEHGFENSDFPEMPVGTYLGVGCKKSSRLIVKAIENSDEKVQTALVVDPRITPFHQRELVSEKILREFPMLTGANPPNGHLNTMRDSLNSLYFEPIHRPGHLLKIEEISEKNAHTQTVTIDQETMTIFQYFQRRYQTTLTYPHLPLLVVKMRRDVSYYPMELSEIVEDQRLRKSQINIDMQQRLLAGSTREPNIMDRDVLRTIASMKLDNSTHLSEAGLHVATDVLKVQGRMIRSPGMQYADAIKQFDSDNSLWKSGKYIEPAEIKNWAVYGIENTMGPKMSLDELRQFAIAFYNLARVKGMKITEPSGISTPAYSGYSDVREVVFNANKSGIQYVLFVTRKDDMTIHEQIKHAEQACGVITQNVTSEVACKATGLQTNKQPQRVTMENIVNKANIKNGGLNYHVGNLQTNQLLGKTDLFIGIAANIQGGGFSGQRLNAPTVVGYAANDLKSACAFSGNYIYQEPLRDEKVRIISEIVTTCVKRFHKNRGQYPKRVFLYRNSGSEGSYDMILKYEIPLVRNALKEAGSELVFMVVTKQHSGRFYPDPIPSGGPIQQNLKPGTVIDKGCVNPYAPEFFLLGHVGRLGTAKMPRYTILANDAKMSMDDLQELSYHLCFAHQIITNMTSLPTPVYVADEMAKRGRTIYTVASTQMKIRTESSDYKKLTEELDYAKWAIRDLRFNA
ncbi:hypothetical protein M3Y94_01003000 [Aphelenchoides besseyi]|nr:hypothetical protein M3Y94_01003000 [Aphelenchoides besseyi]